MLHPSYTDLINVVNKDIEPGEQPSIAIDELYQQKVKILPEEEPSAEEELDTTEEQA